MPVPESARGQGVGCGGPLLRTVRSGLGTPGCGLCFSVVSKQWGHRGRPSLFLVFAVEVEVAFSTLTQRSSQHLPPPRDFSATEWLHWRPGERAACPTQRAPSARGLGGHACLLFGERACESACCYDRLEEPQEAAPAASLGCSAAKPRKAPLLPLSPRHCREADALLTACAKSLLGTAVALLRCGLSQP